MMHDESVFCVKFSKDSELLVSGSQDGKIKVTIITSISLTYKNYFRFGK